MGRNAVIALYIAGFWLVLPALLALPHALWPGELRWHGGAGAAFAGILLLTAGISASVWSIAHLSRRGRGLPISHLPPAMLVTTGPFAFVRHPIYLGYGLMLAGAAMLLGSVPMLSVSLPAFALGAWLYTAAEERVLGERFGGRYDLYRSSTPSFLPGRFALLTLAGWMAAPLFRLKVSREERVTDGGFVVLCPHNNYLDPVFLALALGRPPRFLVTHDMYRTKFRAWLFSTLGAVRVDRFRSTPKAARATIKIVSQGGIAVMFPEGGRSWFGDGWYPSALPGFLSRAGVPVMPVSIEGAYMAWPRWGRPALVPVTVRLGRAERIADPLDLRRTYSALRQRTFSTSRGLIADRKAEGIERILYCCAACGTFGSIGTKGKRVTCGSCRGIWDLRDNGCLVSGKLSFTLPEWHRAAAGRLRDAGVQEAEVVWHIENGAEDRDVVKGAAALRADEDHVAIRSKAGNAEEKLVYGQIDAVLIRANDKLQLYAKGVLHTLRFDDSRALLFQEILRLRAFGSVFQRRRDQKVTVS